MNFKREQLESKIQLLISEIILEELNIDALRNKTTIADVKLNKDNSLAIVFVSFITNKNDKEEEKKLFSLLKKETSQIRRILSKKLPLRFVPQIEFKLDHLIDDINKIENLIKDATK
ncbi:MAG: hypothetical protein HPAVJP_4770 [Candidatus Hepatoplasma vulgare]|nr:MAG: hypothetical protein HPAVJP_4770 [Candidatus Hepatoplasma sp.]